MTIIILQFLHSTIFIYWHACNNIIFLAQARPTMSCILLVVGASLSDNVTAWQSVNAVCLGCMTHGACVGHWTPDYSAMEATGSAFKRRWLDCCHLSMPFPRPAACAGPACVQHACIL